MSSKILKKIEENIEKILDFIMYILLPALILTILCIKFPAISLMLKLITSIAVVIVMKFNFKVFPVYLSALTIFTHALLAILTGIQLAEYIGLIIIPGNIMLSLFDAEAIIHNVAYTYMVLFVAHLITIQQGSQK